MQPNEEFLAGMLLGMFPAEIIYVLLIIGSRQEAKKEQK